MVLKILKKAYFKILRRVNFEKYAKLEGVTIGSNCRFLGYPDFGTEPYLVSIGNHVSISSDCYFITHEGAHWVLKGLDKKYDTTFGYGRIVIHDNVYIGFGVTVLRGVTIGENTIVGARSLVNKSLDANSVYAGVPAKKICSLEEWAEKFLNDMPEYNLNNYKKDKEKEVLRIVDSFSKR